MADQPSSVTEPPRPLGSLVASAQRLTSTNINRFGRSKDMGWQEESIDLYRSVGEQRFLGSTLGNRIGQVRMYVARLAENPLDDPEPIVRPEPLEPGENEGDDQERPEPLSDSDEKALAAWEPFASKPAHLSQILTRCGVNLFSTGDGWVVGIPKTMIQPAEDGVDDAQGTLIPAPAPAAASRPRLVDRQAPAPDNQTIGGLSLDDLEWRYLSVKECRVNPSEKKVTITLNEGDSDKGKIEASPDDLFMIRVWRPDPFEWWQADSPTRSSLPVLRELVGLTMHVSAQIDSRLTGAGVFLIPQEASDAVKASLPNAAQDGQTDPLVQSLMAVMMAAYGDRSSASAMVPIMPVVPGETIEKFKYFTFNSPLDTEARPLREEAIRRLALGQDCPPELLLGVGNMNHWGAWLVQEDTVTTHIEPPAALICDAWTTQYLWPVLTDQGMSEEEAHQYVVWYSVDHMISRPNNFADAKEIHAAGALSDASLRRAGGFDDEDAPPNVDPAMEMVLQMLVQAPSLAQNPTIPVLVEQIRQMMNNEDPTPSPIAPDAEAEDGAPAASEGEDGADGPPGAPGGSETPPEGSETGPPAMAASGLPWADTLDRPRSMPEGDDPRAGHQIPSLMGGKVD